MATLAYNHEEITARQLKPELFELDGISRESVEAHYRLYEGYVSKRNEIGIGRDPHTAEPAEETRRGVGGDYSFHPGAARQRPRQRAVMSTEVERRAKIPVDIVETFDEPIGHLGVQELGIAAARSAIAMQPPGAPIEQRQWEVIGGGHRGETCGSGLTKVPAT